MPGIASCAETSSRLRPTARRRPSGGSDARSPEGHEGSTQSGAPRACSAAGVGICSVVGERSGRRGEQAYHRPAIRKGHLGATRSIFEDILRKIHTNQMVRWRVRGRAAISAVREKIGRSRKACRRQKGRAGRHHGRVTAGAAAHLADKEHVLHPHGGASRGENGATDMVSFARDLDRNLSSVVNGTSP